jgi:hypothetical protein
MIGNTEKYNNPQRYYANNYASGYEKYRMGYAIPGGILTLPVPLPFSKDTGCALPCAAIPYNEIRLHTIFKNWYDVMMIDYPFGRSHANVGGSSNAMSATETTEFGRVIYDCFVGKFRYSADVLKRNLDNVFTTSQKSNATVSSFFTNLSAGPTMGNVITSLNKMTSEVDNLLLSTTSTPANTLSDAFMSTGTATYNHGTNASRLGEVLSGKTLRAHISAGVADDYPEFGTAITTTQSTKLSDVNSYYKRMKQATINSSKILALGNSDARNGTTLTSGNFLLSAAVIDDPATITPTGHNAVNLFNADGHTGNLGVAGSAALTQSTGQATGNWITHVYLFGGVANPFNTTNGLAILTRDLGNAGQFIVQQRSAAKFDDGYSPANFTAVTTTNTYDFCVCSGERIDDPVALYLALRLGRGPASPISFDEAQTTLKGKISTFAATHQAANATKALAQDMDEISEVMAMNLLAGHTNYIVPTSGASDQNTTKLSAYLGVVDTASGSHGSRMRLMREKDNAWDGWAHSCDYGRSAPPASYVNYINTYGESASLSPGDTSKFASGKTPEIVAASWWANYAVVHHSERQQMGKTARDMLIEQYQRHSPQQFTANNKMSVDIRFAHAVRALFFTVQNVTFTGDQSNYNPVVDKLRYDGVDTNTAKTVPPTVDNVTLTYENTHRFSNMPYDYFSHVCPQWNSSKNNITPGLYMYSYALDVRHVDPCGHTNYSRLNNVNVSLEASQFAQRANTDWTGTIEGNHRQTYNENKEQVSVYTRDAKGLGMFPSDDVKSNKYCAVFFALSHTILRVSSGCVGFPLL